MTTTKLKCGRPECPGILVPQPGRTGPLALLELLKENSSTLFNMAKGSANRRINGEVRICDTCGHFELFRTPAGFTALDLDGYGLRDL